MQNLWLDGERGGDSPGTTGRLKSWLWGSNRSACFSKPLSSAETETGPLCGRGPGAGGIPGPRQDPGSRTLPPAVRLKPVQLGERVEVQKGTPGRGRASRQGHTAFLSAAQLSPPWSVGAHPPAKGHGGPLSWTRISAARKPRQRHLPCEAEHKTRQVKHPVEETQTSPSSNDSLGEQLWGPRPPRPPRPEEPKPHFYNTRRACPRKVSLRPVCDRVPASTRDDEAPLSEHSILTLNERNPATLARGSRLWK
ncbi:uncharacterized protein LOC125910906 [Panthera uncia]|uniref:uncharacterized protein LOC125910906 n=1 Tax=Panthera uncia TaxID=29064 RepID=UPI0020FFC86F|nr:uncharacterized protein LOC125910906 [Panthera uncia]